MLGGRYSTRMWTFHQYSIRYSMRSRGLCVSVRIIAFLWATLGVCFVVYHFLDHHFFRSKKDTRKAVEIWSPETSPESKWIRYKVGCIPISSVHAQLFHNLDPQHYLVRCSLVQYYSTVVRYMFRNHRTTARVHQLACFCTAATKVERKNSFRFAKDFTMFYFWYYDNVRRKYDHYRKRTRTEAEFVESHVGCVFNRIAI